jgi:hypothetical protein
MTIEEAKRILEEVKTIDDSIFQYDPAYMEALETVLSHGEWIPVEERLPEYGEVVLVCGVKGGVYTAMLKTDGWNGWWKMNTRNHWCEPLAWMPLPEPCEE